MDAGTLELVELDTALDWDHVPTCEVLVSGCDAEANFIQINECCGASWYSCATHVLVIDAYVLSMRSYFCNACRAIKPAYRWVPLP